MKNTRELLLNTLLFHSFQRQHQSVPVSIKSLLQHSYEFCYFPKNHDVTGRLLFAAFVIK